MIARGFKPVGWVAGVAVAAIGCYMVSLRVASERAELASLERRIIATRQDIRSLQTELGTRGRLTQLERWNAEVLALSAPAAEQFLESSVKLARFDVNAPPLEASSPVRMASAEPAPAAPAVPAVRQASAALPLPADAPQPAIRRASLTVEDAAAPARVRPASAPAPAPLIDQGTLRAIADAARDEGGGAD